MFMVSPLVTWFADFLLVHWLKHQRDGFSFPLRIQLDVSTGSEHVGKGYSKSIAYLEPQDLTS